MEAVIKAASPDFAPPRAFVSGVEASAPGGVALRSGVGSGLGTRQKSSRNSHGQSDGRTPWQSEVPVMVVYSQQRPARPAKHRRRKRAL